MVAGTHGVCVFGWHAVQRWRVRVDGDRNILKGIWTGTPSMSNPGSDARRQRQTMPSTEITRTAIPAPVSFRGMPAARFWEFEDAQVDFGSVDAGPTDLARMLLVEFALDYGNDWFVIPIELDVGSLYRTRSLVITDTFGVRTLIKSVANPDDRIRSGECSSIRIRAGADLPKPASNLFFLPPSLLKSVWRAGRLKRCCSCATRWRIWPGRSNALSKARPSDRSTDLKHTWNRNDAANRSRRREPSSTAPDTLRYRLATESPRLLDSFDAGADEGRASSEARRGAQDGRPQGTCSCTGTHSGVRGMSFRSSKRKCRAKASALRAVISSLDGSTVHLTSG